MTATERAEVIAIYREYKQAIDDKYLDIGAMDADLMSDYLTACRELARLERIHRCESDLLEFAIEYFSEGCNEGNAGNWEGFDITRREDAAQFHKEICDIMNEVSTTKPNAKTAVAAPRSHAKSSYLTKAFPLHEVVYRKRKYIIIISETPSVSAPNLEWLGTQLKHNEKLREDFGPLLSVKQQENPKDNNAEFIAWEPRENGAKRQLTKVEAASTGQALRGRNWNGARPDLVVCDDLEDAKTNAATEEQRTKLREWFQSVVMPLGDPKGERTATVYMGTTVHWDSLLMHILYKRSDFTTKVYRAIVEPPERGDLWEQCRELYVDRENPQRLDEAKTFYETNREEMNKGAVVLWAEVQPLWKLMTWKWDNSSKAFNTEYQNNPIDEESMIFNPAKFTYWDKTDPDRKFSHSDYVIAMGVDFAMGKTTRGDYSSLTVTAKHKQTGVYYVIDSFLERLHPDAYMKVIVEKALKWQPDVIGAEAQMAQEFFVDKLKESLYHSGYPAHNRVKKIYQRSRKELRIEAMLPDIESKKIQFSTKHALLLEQFERYGSGSHDDGPDSCEIAISVSKQAKRQLQNKPIWM
ncbi:phage terminase large subunit [Bacillus sp. JJ722]|uniref:phage terminase large subunit n=1 Tax=Bacillus sp. JJ722 TaxID=3122973 RepID=UPI002FFEBC14